jgi:hypothetical protein
MMAELNLNRALKKHPKLNYRHMLVTAMGADAGTLLKVSAREQLIPC